MPTEPAASRLQIVYCIANISQNALRGEFFNSLRCVRNSRVCTSLEFDAQYLWLPRILHARLHVSNNKIFTFGSYIAAKSLSTLQWLQQEDFWRFVNLVQENTHTASKQVNTDDGPASSVMTQNDSTVTVERDLVSQAEEEDMEALLDTYV